MANKLLTSGISPNEGTRCEENADLDNTSPLMIASASGFEQIVEMLLVHQADLLQITRSKTTALMRSSSEIITLSLLKHAKEKDCFIELLNMRDVYNHTVFEYAVRNNHLGTVQKLIEIENWHLYVNLSSFLHESRLSSLKYPENFHEYDQLCLAIRSKRGISDNQEINFPKPTEVNSVKGCYQLLFNENMTKDRDLWTREEALKDSLAQAYALMGNPESCLKYLRFLNQELIRFFKLINEPLPVVDQDAYAFKTIDNTTYPIPTQHFSDLHLHKKSALQRVLIALFRKYGLAKHAFEWIGFIDHTIADQMVREGDFFKENILGPGLFHGALSHMLQQAIFIYAIENNEINLNYSIDDQSKISIQDMLAAFVNIKTRENETVWASIRDRRSFKNVSFADPHRLSSIIMRDGKQLGLSILADSLIDSFCKGYLKLLKAYENISPVLKQTPETFAIQINDVMSHIFGTPQNLLNYAIAKKTEKVPIGAIIEEGDYAAIPLQYEIEPAFKPEQYHNQPERDYLKALITLNQPEKNAVLLKQAIKNGATQQVEYLLEAGVNPNQQLGSNTPLSLALQLGYEEIACLLLAHGAHPNDSVGNSSLIYIISKGYSCVDKIAELLIKHPAIDINARDELGRTALYHAVYNNKISWVEYLLNHGADANINRLDNCGTPLMLAIQTNMKQAVVALIAHKANVNTTIKASVIILLSKLFYQQERNNFCAMLTQQESKSLPEYIEHFTPLQMAVFLNRKKMVKQLLLAGATLEVNANGIDVIELARRLNNKNILIALETYQRQQMVCTNLITCGFFCRSDMTETIRTDILSQPRLQM